MGFLMKKYPCDQCGRMMIHGKTVNGMRLCNKHYNQFQKYGKFLDDESEDYIDPDQIDVTGENGNITPPTFIIRIAMSM